MKERIVGEGRLMKRETERMKKGGMYEELMRGRGRGRGREIEMEEELPGG